MTPTRPSVPPSLSDLPGGIEPRWKAIAALSENRVIGQAGKIPWHLPEDFRWFKQTTMGHLLLMGRKTFDSIGRPLPGRTTVVLTRQSWSHPGVQVIHDLSEIPPLSTGQELFIAGGAEIYALTLDRCADLYLTVVKRAVAGDTFFPEVDDRFARLAIWRDEPEFRIEHWRSRRLLPTSSVA